jgi:hypothetical protein
VIGNKWVFKNK